MFYRYRHDCTFSRPVSDPALFSLIWRRRWHTLGSRKTAYGCFHLVPETKADTNESGRWGLVLLSNGRPSLGTSYSILGVQLGRVIIGVFCRIV